MNESELKAVIEELREILQEAFKLLSPEELKNERSSR
jgi:hypothetical protein